MNLATVTEKVRTRIHAVITEMVSEITQEVTKEVVSQLAGAPSIAPVKRATRAAAPKRATRAEPEKKAPAARKPKAEKKAAKPAKAAKAKPAKTAAAPQGQRYNLDPNEVLVKLAFYGETGTKAETIRNDFFAGIPTPVFTRALKKLIGEKLVKVTGERRAATYFVTAKGLKKAGMVDVSTPAPSTTDVPADVVQEAGDEDLSKTNGASSEPVSTRFLQDNTAEDAAS